MRFTTLALAAAFSSLSIATYVLEDDFMTDFYGHFDFFDGPDPTHGFVKYVNESTARQMHLIYPKRNGAAWGVDYTNVTLDGRPSIRLESKKRYTQGLWIIDVSHMPYGCGTWPAFWSFGPYWPLNGEIDIIEGVHEDQNNSMTLHTNPGCSISRNATSEFLGKVKTYDCYVYSENQTFNAGCGVTHPSYKSYGAGMNRNGGGVYAMEWTSQDISVYFFPRGSIPSDVLSATPNPQTWSKAAARFSSRSCDIDNLFSGHRIIFDTTFCGDWAGNEFVWNNGTCGRRAPTCLEYVRDNPRAFRNAYWSINSLKVFKNPSVNLDLLPPARVPNVTSSAPVTLSTISNSLPPVYTSHSTTPAGVFPSQLPEHPIHSVSTFSAEPSPIESPPGPKDTRSPVLSPTHPPAPESTPPSHPSSVPPEHPPISPAASPISPSASPGKSSLPGWNWPAASSTSPANDKPPAPASPTPQSPVPNAHPSPSGQPAPGVPEIPVPYQSSQPSSSGPSATPHKTLSSSSSSSSAAPGSTSHPGVHARMEKFIAEHRRRGLGHGVRI